MSVTIPHYTLENGVVLYQIHTRLPLRSISASKRYSEFAALRDALCADSGISKHDFPYAFPSKSGVFSNKEKVALERQTEFARLLESLIRDKEFQNSPVLHRFLNVPPNFQFSSDLFESESEASADDKFTISESALNIDKAQWLIYCRHLRSIVNALTPGSNLADRVANRQKYLRYIEPNLKKLAASLANFSGRNELTPDELRSRRTLLTGIQEKVESALNSDGNRPPDDESPQDVSLSSRVLAMPKKYSESADTIDSSNKELLQKQQQIHQNQDKELEELRKVIARQRQMGEAINAEVEEQNEMLSSFGDQVEKSSDKIAKARARTRKIG